MVSVSPRLSGVWYTPLAVLGVAKTYWTADGSTPSTAWVGRRQAQVHRPAVRRPAGRAVAPDRGHRRGGVGAVRGVHGPAHRPHHHASGRTMGAPGVTQPVQEAPEHRVLDRPVRGHALDVVGRAGGANVMEGDRQPAAAMSGRTAHVVLQVRQANRACRVRRDGAHRLWILGRQGLGPRPPRRGFGPGDAAASPGIRESTLGDDLFAGPVVRAEGVGERLRVVDAVSQHVLAGSADLLPDPGCGEGGQVRVIDSVGTDVIALALQGPQLSPGHAAWMRPVRIRRDHIERRIHVVRAQKRHGIPPLAFPSVEEGE